MSAIIGALVDIDSVGNRGSYEGDSSSHHSNHLWLRPNVSVRLTVQSVKDKAVVQNSRANIRTDVYPTRLSLHASGLGFRDRARFVPPSTAGPAAPPNLHIRRCGS